MKNRVFSSCALLLLFIPFIIKGGLFFTSLVFVTGLLAFHELFSLKLKNRKLSILLEVLAYLIVGFLILNNFQTNDLSIILDYRVLTFIIFIFMIPLVLIGDNNKYNLQDAFYLIGIVIFIGLSFNLIILIRNYSVDLLIYILMITCFTDLFGLIAGKLIGVHKLAPKISPNKTIEGFCVGTCVGTFMGIIYYLTVINSSISFINLLIITITLSMIGQIGDLIFSQIKRYYNKKDFSNIIPGHGGVLDLLDSLIFVSVTVILFINIL